MVHDAEELLLQQLRNNGRHTSLWGRIKRAPALISDELGLSTFMGCPLDVYIVIFIRMVRLVAFHGIQIMLIVYLKELKFEDQIVGLFMTLTFTGDLVTSFFLSIIADNVGRRNIFMFSSVTMAVTGMAFLFISDPMILMIIAFIGIMTPGGDVGPFKSLESSSLALIVPYEKRSDIYAWYGFLPKCSASIGVLGAGFLINAVEDNFGYSKLKAYKSVFVCYILIAGLMFFASYFLSDAIEWKHEEVFSPVDKKNPEEEAVETMISPSSVSSVHSDSAVGVDEVGDETLDAIEEDIRSLEEDELRNIAEDDDNSTAVVTATDVNRVGERRRAQSISNESIEPNERSALLPQYSSDRRTSVHSRGNTEDMVKKIKSIRILPKLSGDSLLIVCKLSALFALDAFASSFIGGSWQAYYILRKFDVQPSQLGGIFFTTGFISGFTSLLGSTLCKRLGPIYTMVVTHLPASILIAVLPFPNTLRLTFAVLIVRSCVQAMDAAPKQVFLSAIVPPNERTSVLGWVNVVKTLSHTLGPSVAGYFLSLDMQWICFVLAGGLKVAYDLGILFTFVSLNPQDITH